MSSRYVYGPICNEITDMLYKSVNHVCFPPPSLYNESFLSKVGFVDLYDKLRSTVQIFSCCVYDLVSTCRLVVLKLYIAVTVHIQVLMIC